MIVRAEDLGWNAALRPRDDVGVEPSITARNVKPIYDADARTKGEPVERDRVLVGHRVYTDGVEL